jgi:glutathione S-transferase
VELLGHVGDGGITARFLNHRAVLSEFARDPSYAERDELLLKRPLGVLNDALAGRDYLVGNSFTVADLNVAGILVWGKMGRLNLSNHADARDCAVIHRRRRPRRFCVHAFRKGTHPDQD